ncbi:hypothetical protein TNCV_4032741 [Trichonephila clavipes]|nr:hypothetical protein TNCV_4032741 [Trichonephila clavipes]
MRLITAFDSQGIKHKELLPEGTTMNSVRYFEILTRFMKRVHRAHTRPLYVQRGSWFFVQCSPPHSQYRQIVPGKKGGVQIEPPPYLPDLNPPNFFLLPPKTRTERKEIWRYS